MSETFDPHIETERGSNDDGVETKEDNGWFFDSVESAVNAAKDAYDSAIGTIEDKADKFFGEDSFSTEVEEVISDFKEEAKKILIDFHEDVSATIPQTQTENKSSDDRSGGFDVVSHPNDYSSRTDSTDDLRSNQHDRNSLEGGGRVGDLSDVEEALGGVEDQEADRLLDALEETEEESSQSHKELKPESFSTSGQGVECQIDINGKVFETKTGQEFDAGGTKKYFELTNGDEDLLLALPLSETGSTAQIGESEQANANLFNEARVHTENPNLDLINFAGLVAFDSNTGEAVQIDVEKFK